MNLETISTDILVIGAGVSGLMAAVSLQGPGRRVMVVDKAPRVGGRLATEQFGSGRADFGAQFFTVRSPQFQPWVEEWLAADLVYRWANGWSDGSLAPITFNGHPRYAVHGGMQALAEHLAWGLDVRLETEIVELSLTPAGWQSRDKNNRLYTAQALILTPPVPQSLALLDRSQVPLSEENRTALERIKYAPCLAGIFWLEGAVHLPEPGAIQHPHAPISWIADNQRKGISPESPVVTVHAGAAYSHKLWDVPDQEVLAALQAGFLPYLGPGSSILEAHLKRWTYAFPTVLYPEPYLLVADLPPLVLAGDAFNGPRVEGAFLSGLAAAQVLARNG